MSGIDGHLFSVRHECISLHYGLSHGRSVCHSNPTFQSSMTPISFSLRSSSSHFLLFFPSASMSVCDTKYCGLDRVRHDIIENGEFFWFHSSSWVQYFFLFSYWFLFYEILTFFAMGYRCVVFSNCTQGNVYFGTGKGGGKHTNILGFPFDRVMMIWNRWSISKFVWKFLLFNFLSLSLCCLGSYPGSCSRAVPDAASCLGMYPNAFWLRLPIQVSYSFYSIAWNMNFCLFQDEASCTNPLNLPADVLPGFCLDNIEG